jgi:hypothetical protein
MRISNRANIANGGGNAERPRAEPAAMMFALETITLSAALGFLPEFAAARAHAVLQPHPGWIAVVTLAARYGGRGFALGLIAAVVSIGMGSALAGQGLVPAIGRLGSAPNLIALGTCMVVSWVASWHLRRREKLRERVRALTDQTARAEDANQTLQEVVASLRARVDRSSTSLTFLRDVAHRLEGTDPVAAAEGAAELALARTGASAAAVKVGMGRFERLLAVRDARARSGLAPLALRDADLAVPIRNGSDRVGMIVLWEVPRPALDEPTTRDLELIASWCVRALTVAAWRAEETSGRALGVR